jgi:hypothetical protein
MFAPLSQAMPGSRASPLGGAISIPPSLVAAAGLGLRLAAARRPWLRRRAAKPEARQNKDRQQSSSERFHHRFQSNA